MKHAPVLLLTGLAALAVCALSTPSGAQLLFPEIIVDVQRLPEEAQTKLAGLDSILAAYLKNQEWAGDEYQYDFDVQISIYFTDYSPDPQEDKYKAKLIATNKKDVRLEDVRWEFGLRQPYLFRPGQYHPFKSVVEFYVWMLFGTEFDRLEKLGGRPHYEKAKQIYLESSSSIYYFGWDRRIEQLRSMTDDAIQTERELNFFYYTGIYYDGGKNYSAAKDYLYYALVKLDKVSFEVQKRFLEVNHRQFAEALVRAGHPKGVRALMQMDPDRRQIYETILPDSSQQKAGTNR